LTSTNQYKAWIDGACRGNPGEAAIGGILKSPNGKIAFQFSLFIGIATNNVAEYRALIYLLTIVKELNSKIKLSGLVVYSDSELLVKQVNGLYKVRKKHLVPLYDSVKRLISQLPFPVQMVHVERWSNQEADRLANLAFP
jgi:ribonuclease HI